MWLKKVKNQKKLSEYIKKVRGHNKYDLMMNIRFI